MARTPVYLLTAATAIGSMGLAAGGSAGALLAADITGSEAAAGLPIGALVAGSALGAVLIARISATAGRPRGLMAGYGAGIMGAALVVGAAVAANLALVLIGSAVLGVANVAVFLSRYAVAGSGDDQFRGRDMGIVLAGAAVGAVTAPNLLGVTGKLAVDIGLPRLTGLYLLAIPAFALAGCILSRLRRPGPEPLAVVQLRAADTRSGGARRAVLLLAITNLVMVAVMAIAPVHMTGHGHGLDLVGVIVSIHVLCMFAPAPATGRLADRYGGSAVAGVGFLLFVAAGVVGALADQHGVVGITVALALLGLGWNAGVVAASTMLTASVRPAERAKAEGLGEMAMGLAAGAGAPVAGLVTAYGGFETLAAASAVIATLAVVVMLLIRPTEP
ncbi:MFS transporter [Phytoactinopolyspora alkaliphila]|uniref:MFS transporter n=1 Tax=Phytoactinopolyspora alkaliphila TaxID=1783498 RepID=A0A6N9YLL4_9ACTN|nr:MFS transporter [Phytoactinopolyspora alkaliphila]